ncbi:MAG TPA: DUF1858 domain-containing protein [Planctomycetota bacterium]|nr:DUF1858 domain-containing protein [Planctomycetota bacterium]
MSRKKPDPPPPAPRFRSDDVVADVVDRDPRAKDVLLSFGLPCFKCIVAYDETLAEGCAPLLLNVDEIVARLNALPPLDAPGGAGGA